MSRFIESIRINNGKAERLELHNHRLNKTRKLYFAAQEYIDINPIIYSLDLPSKGLFKCRITYSKTIENNIELRSYTPKKISSLKCVYDDTLSYDFKYADRKSLHKLYKERGVYDDILIIKNKLITDSYYCNIALLSSGIWYTPHLPLLHGTQRSCLLTQGIIKNKRIPIDEIGTYEKLALFNAMIPFEEKIEVDIKNILI